MYKRLLSFIIMLLASLTLVSCVKETDDKLIDSSKDFYNVMGTSINVTIYNQPETKINELMSEIELMFINYNELTDNYKKYDSTGKSDITSGYDSMKVINNIAYINENPGLEIKINKNLYTILQLSDEYRVETNGYFDISIGIIVDMWKDFIDRGQSLSEEEVISDAEFNAFIDDVTAVPVIENGIILSKTEEDYFVTIANGVKIDLGAIAKGYVVELAADLMKENDVKEYKIGGSDSSLYFGENPNRPTGLYHIGILSPKKDEQYAAIEKVKNTSIGTSGDIEQYYLFKGVKYHHIISPITKMPENYRSLVTLVGPDAGKIDALTTALMSMDSETLCQWRTNNTQYKVYDLIGD